MKLLKKVFKALTNLYLLVFVNGCLLTSMIYFKTEATYDAEIFKAIAHYIVRDSIGKNNDDTFLLRALDISNDFEHNRLNIFKHKEIKGLKANVFHPVTMDLITGNGACGSASAILARILKSYDYKVRLAQMVTSSNQVGHIIVEVNKDNRWIVLDPLYNFYLKDSVGNFASFKDVQNNFEYYKKQFPPDYPLNYNYSGVHYTNWKKIKFIGPITKSILDFFIGKEKADGICIRSYILRNYNILFLVTRVLFITLSLFTVWQFWKQRKAITNIH